MVHAQTQTLQAISVAKAGKILPSVLSIDMSAKEIIWTQFVVQKEYPWTKTFRGMGVRDKYRKSILYINNVHENILNTD